MSNDAVGREPTYWEAKQVPLADRLRDIAQYLGGHGPSFTPTEAQVVLHAAACAIDAHTAPEQPDALREALDAMLDWALSNRDTPHEFVTCYTYALGEFPPAIIQAKRALARSTHSAAPAAGPLASATASIPDDPGSGRLGCPLESDGGTSKAPENQ
jgi:hypothetical protein